MERSKLITARLRNGLSQEELAEKIGCSREIVSRWERGLSTPYPHWVRKLCSFFESNPEDLDIHAAPRRRQVLQMMVGAGVAGALMSFGNTELSPEKFLRQCNVVMKVCWQHMDNGDYVTVESILAEYAPTLESLAKDSSRVQKMAASLATQAKLLEVKLATQSHDFVYRQLLCLEAVQFGELSKDSYLHAAALYWHGDTYTYCYHHPQEAIGIFQNGMKHLGGSALLESKLSLNLAVAHAQDGDEKQALDCLGRASNNIPKHPEADPGYPYVLMGKGNLEKHIGRVYLALAEYLPDYAQRASDIFGEGVVKCSHQGDLSQTLIHKADAMCYLGDLHEYAQSLSEGQRIATHRGWRDLQHQARVVLHKAPAVWHKERIYQDLLALF
jgi:transcriptional regulator with XRE-family HTH domain/tetratricopeptide (TPR) repeat protein